MRERLRERLAGHEFLRHVLVLMSGTTLAQLLPIAASPIISRLYSPEEMGIYTMFMAFVNGLLTVATWRYDLAIVPAADPAEARALVRLSVRLSTITCVVVGVGLFAAAGPLSAAVGMPALKPWLAAVGLVAWSYSQVSIFSYWCNRAKNYRLMSVNRVGQSVTTTGTQLAFGAAALGTTGLVLSTFLGQVVAGANLFLRTRKEIYGLPHSPLKAVAREHRKMPLLNAPTAALDAVRLYGTQLMIGAFFAAGAIGQFGQAWKLLQTPAGLINSSLSQVFFQRLAVTERGQMLGLVRRTIGRSLLIGVVPFGLIYLLSPPLFPLVFGERWALAGLIGAALVPWLYANFVTSPISLLFVVVRRQGVVFCFGLFFTAAPLTLLALRHTDLLETITLLSWLMAALLAVFLLLALWVARDYDRGVGTLAMEDAPVDPDAPQEADAAEAQEPESTSRN
ncbi:MAG: lipopolysaccharide biosynthesis protein [Arachnia sp.]